LVYETANVKIPDFGEKNKNFFIANVIHHHKLAKIVAKNVSECPRMHHCS
jgi:hypothetical protein